MRFIVGALTAAALLSPATASSQQCTDGVAINSMWDFMGTLGYATCLQMEYKIVPEAAPEREKQLKQAVKACHGSARKMFKDATMDGQPFQPMLIELALQIEPQVRDYLLPILRDLPPSQTETRKRLRLMIAGQDGKGYEMPSEEHSKIPDNARFYVEIAPASAAQ